MRYFKFALLLLVGAAVGITLDRILKVPAMPPAVEALHIAVYVAFGGVISISARRWKVFGL